MGNQARTLDISPLARLERSIRRTRGFSLNFLEVAHGRNQEHYEQTLRSRLSDTDLVWIEIDIEFGVRTVRPILTEKLAGLAEGQRAILSFRNVDLAFHDYHEGLSLTQWLNVNRDLQKGLFPHVWLIWLPWEAVGFMQTDAPDFFSWNRGIYMLEEDPKDVRLAFLARYRPYVSLFLETMLDDEDVPESRVEFELAIVYRSLKDYNGWMIPRFWVLYQISERLGLDRREELWEEIRPLDKYLWNEINQDEELFDIFLPIALEIFRELQSDPFRYLVSEKLMRMSSVSTALSLAFEEWNKSKMEDDVLASGEGMLGVEEIRAYLRKTRQHLILETLYASPR